MVVAHYRCSLTCMHMYFGTKVSKYSHVTVFKMWCIEKPLNEPREVHD